MKYQYFYQNKKNENISDWIVAKDRADAYAQLKKRGIKPFKLIGKNPLPWKRWAAIGVLSISLVVAIGYIALSPREMITTVTPTSTDNAEVNGVKVVNSIPRHQIYGDPAIIAEGIKSDWATCDLMAGEKFLSRYAQPGLPVQSPHPAMAKLIVRDVTNCLTNKLQASNHELTEYAQIKEIIESMKTELRTYVSKGGSVNSYLHRLVDRQQQELAYYNAALQEVTEAKNKLEAEALYDFWAKKNSELRAIGLPMVKFPSK